MMFHLKTCAKKEKERKEKGRKENIVFDILKYNSE
jgi:hypothetical protein